MCSTSSFYYRLASLYYRKILVQSDEIHECPSTAYITPWGVTMNYQAHQFGGACTGLTAGLLLTQSQPPAMVLTLCGILTITGAIGGLFPDIDHQGSKIGKRVKSVSAIINKTAGHRGAIHAPILYVLMAGIFMFVAEVYELSMVWSLVVFGFLLGCYSHLALDLMTIEGIPVLWPLSKRKYRIFKLRTGPDDWKGCVLFALMCIVLVFIQYHLL